MKKIGYGELIEIIEEKRTTVGWLHIRHTYKNIKNSELGVWELLEYVERLYRQMRGKGFLLKDECFYKLMDVEKKEEIKEKEK